MKLPLTLAAVFIVTVIGCNNRSEELQKQNSTLQTQNNQLTQDLTARDEYIDNITQSINDVYSSLESVRTHEGMVLTETNAMEAKKKLTSQEVRQKLMAQVSLIDSSLKDNHRRIADLQTRLNSAKTQYAGLKRMVANLQRTVAERESTITELGQRILGLEAEVGTKTKMLAERDSTIQEQHQLIGSQHSEINRAYYIIGKRRDLESKGVITSQGGFLWGLLGSSTVLASGFDAKLFTAIDKFESTTIDINGRIDELIPKRKEQFYTATEVSRDKSTLTIAEPQAFWQDKYLVIITD
jgi:predicted  nucleic acid-binding Zn-ribbon protein